MCKVLLYQHESSGISCWQKRFDDDFLSRRLCVVTCCCCRFPVSGFCSSQIPFSSLWSAAGWI